MHRLDGLPEDQLVVFAQAGSLEAYDALVRRYRAAVVLVARQELHCTAQAEDAAQDALLLAFRALPQLREPERFAAWLCAIARHRARRIARQDGRTEPAEPDELDRAVLAQSQELSIHPADELVRRDERERAMEALAFLPADHQTVLWLHYLEDWPVARIAQFLSLPVTTVKWRMHRGRELLRRRLHLAEEEEDE